MKSNTRKLVQAALLLTICLLAQYFKSLSVYITGPVINACLIIAALAVGPAYAVILSVITPVTAFFIAASPIMAGIPLMFPAVMAGNAILALTAYFFNKKIASSWRLPAGLIAGSLLKAIFMALVIVGVLLPVFGADIAIADPKKLAAVLNTARITFSVTQLITALLGSLLAYLIWIPLQKYLAS